MSVLSSLSRLTPVADEYWLCICDKSADWSLAFDVAAAAVVAALPITWPAYWLSVVLVAGTPPAAAKAVVPCRLLDRVCVIDGSGAPALLSSRLGSAVRDGLTSIVAAL